LIHIKPHTYRSRYTDGNLTYTEKFENNLYFLIPKEKVEEMREKMEKLRETNRRLAQ
jgi:DNA-binding transcriptional regulator/RsmH inhibitor MraZ